jgi:FAD binding domain-containing protein
VYRSTIEEVALDSWTRGRVVLVGDAAHATSPNMAEGAAMALGGCAGAHGVSAWPRDHSRRTVGLRGPPPTANGLGAGADASPRPNSLPPHRGPKRGPSGIRPKDLPIELPTPARRGLAGTSRACLTSSLGCPVGNRSHQHAPTNQLDPRSTPLRGAGLGGYGGRHGVLDWRRRVAGRDLRSFRVVGRHLRGRRELGPNRLETERPGLVLVALSPW